MSKHFFSKDQAASIVTSIKEAEQNTSGEIRVHIQKHLKHDTVMQEAEYLFGKLSMQNTKDKNAVLFLLATEAREFAIYSDKGINDVVPENFWEDIKNEVLSLFKAGKFQEGLSKGISKTGEKLKSFFPFEKNTDENELDDEISYE